MTLEEQFEKIAEDAISKAEGVKCSIGDFREGLKTMVGAMRSRLDMEPPSRDDE